MTTAAFNMQERKDPDFVNFSDGDMVSGVLLSIERIQVGKEGQPKQPANRYTIQDLDDGKLYAFLGTHQLDTKLRMTDVGHVIEVRCEGNDPNVTRNGNPMKKFKVLVSNVPYSGKKTEDGTYITNDDIGF
jgi:hypothetical protein